MRVSSCERVVKYAWFCIAVVVVVCFSSYSHGQLWQGIIDPSRAVDWSNAGVLGGIPNRTTVCANIAPYTGSAATINNAIASCPSGQVVSLQAGIFNLSSGIDFTQHSNVTLRGQGADKTFLIFTGAGAGGYGSVISMEGSVSGNGYENNVCDWTAGYAKGTTTISLANCGTTTPAKGSLSNLKVGTLLILDQLDEPNDTGTIWNCAENSGNTDGTGGTQLPPCANTIQGGESRTNGPCNAGGGCLRSQQQGVIVTAISGSSVTFSPGLYMPNWRSSQKPQAWFPNTTVSSDGVENLSFDAANAGSGQSAMASNCNQCWVKGVRGLNANRSHVRFLWVAHSVMQDSYFYANINHGSVSYGAELMGAWDSLVQNNIFQQDTDSEPSCSGACAGNVIAYNLDINNVYTSTTGFMQAGFYQHAAGDEFNLWEGNIGPGYNADSVHGTHHFNTIFRNQLLGMNQATCNGSPCVLNTIPVTLTAGSRYMNVIGNVLGQAGYHKNYTCLVTANGCLNNETSIYDLQQSGENAGQVVSGINGFCLSPSCSSTGPYDPQVSTYLYRWGNYDTVTGAVRWCGNTNSPSFATVCNNISEVPTSLVQFSNAVPASTALPPSFYLKSKPGWFRTAVPFPPIGPDVTSGNIPNVGGFANHNSATDCYLNVMSGPADGSGNALTFSANTCYAASTGTGPAPPPAPTITVR